MSIYNDNQVKADFFTQLEAENTRSPDSFGAKRDAIEAKHPLGWAVAGIFAGLALTGVGFLGFVGGLSHIPSVVQLLPEAFKNYYVVGVTLGVGVIGVGVLGRSAVVCDGNRLDRNTVNEEIDEAENRFKQNFRTDLFQDLKQITEKDPIPNDSRKYLIEENEDSNVLTIRDFDNSIKRTQKLTNDEKNKVVAYLGTQGFSEHVV